MTPDVLMRNKLLLLCCAVAVCTIAIFGCGDGGSPDQGHDTSSDGDADAEFGSEGDGIDTFEDNQSAESPPVPVILMDNATNINDHTIAVINHPLDEVFINGCASISPTDSYPLEYWWELVAAPENAANAELICSGCQVNDPEHTVVEKVWSEECLPKLYLPVAGAYRVRLKVRDRNKLDSADAVGSDSIAWFYVTLNVAPTEKIYVQLTWDRGEGVDMDLFLAQHRSCGTMGAKEASLDKVSAPVASFPISCRDADDCHGLPCSAEGVCDISCVGDDDCTVGHPAWLCGDDHSCAEAEDRSWACLTDADCRGEGFCSPAAASHCGGAHICTTHTSRQINDSCGSGNGLESNVDFGEPCNHTDDASLDRDDTDGYGPEIISIAAPSSGRYRAVVRLYHDASGSLSTDNPATANLSVYLNGVACQARTLMFAAKGMNWKAVDIQWPESGTPTCAGNVQTIALNPVDADQGADRQCSDRSDCSAFGIDQRYANPYRFDSSLHDPCATTDTPRNLWCDAADDADCDTSCCAAR